jgi:lysophospholipase L1-like esterase
MKLLFAGDSLIEYYDWQERFRDHKVANFGLAGESVQGLLGRIVKFPELFPEADMIFLMSGINNVAMGDTGFIGFYHVIVEKLLAAYPGSSVYVHSLLPVAVDFIDNGMIIDVNESLKKMAVELDVNFVDLHRRYALGDGSFVKEYLLDDGVHLSRAGYEVWASVVEGILKSSP